MRWGSVKEFEIPAQVLGRRHSTFQHCRHATSCGAAAAVLPPCGAPPFTMLTFVGGQRKQINTEPAEIKATLRSKLGGVGVEQNSPLATCFGYGANRLEASHFTLGCGERHQGCGRGEKAVQMVEINHSIPIHRPQIKLPSLTFQLASGGSDRWMLNC